MYIFAVGFQGGFSHVFGYGYVCITSQFKTRNVCLEHVLSNMNKRRNPGLIAIATFVTLMVNNSNVMVLLSAHISPSESSSCLSLSNIIVNKCL